MWHYGITMHYVTFNLPLRSGGLCWTWTFDLGEVVIWGTRVTLRHSESIPTHRSHQRKPFWWHITSARKLKHMHRVKCETLENIAKDWGSFRSQIFGVHGQQRIIRTSNGRSLCKLVETDWNSSSLKQLSSIRQLYRWNNSTRLQITHQSQGLTAVWKGRSSGVLIE